MEKPERNTVNERELYEEGRPPLRWVLEKIAAIPPVSEKSKMVGKGSVRLRAIEAKFSGATVTGAYFWQTVTGLYIR
jgi:hypothetical protein